MNRSLQNIIDFVFDKDNIVANLILLVVIILIVAGINTIFKLIKIRIKNFTNKIKKIRVGDNEVEFNSPVSEEAAADPKKCTVCVSSVITGLPHLITRLRSIERVTDTKESQIDCYNTLKKQMTMAEYFCRMIITEFKKNFLSLMSKYREDMSESAVDANTHPDFAFFTLFLETMFTMAKDKFREWFKEPELINIADDRFVLDYCVPRITEMIDTVFTSFDAQWQNKFIPRKELCTFLENTWTSARSMIQRIFDNARTIKKEARVEKDKIETAYVQSIEDIVDHFLQACTNISDDKKAGILASAKEIL